MRYKEADIIVPELDALPDVQAALIGRASRGTELLWKYQKKDLMAVAKRLNRSIEACRMKLLSLKRERGVSE